MESKTYYLKYRPQLILDLDLVEVRTELSGILQSKKIPHALLFSGPKGTGKTSAARIFAKAINCLKPKKSGEPCNQCLNCTEITNGTALDLIEIDAASNRGIDDIRDLREKIKLSPSRFTYKVYIIDEVHMLTNEAFNALLKTLEEPPSHAIFILCTTDPQKLPATIISRCLKFNFRKARPAEVESCLKRAVAGEKLKLEKGVLEAIGKSVDGSFRDAHKLLEQLAVSSKKVTLKHTQELLGLTEELLPAKLLTLLEQKETKAALKEIDRVVQLGGDLAVFTQAVLNTLRLEMLYQLKVSEVEPAVNNFDIGGIKILINLFSQAFTDLKYNPIPQLPLELAVVEWCESKNSSSAPNQPELRQDKQNTTAHAEVILKSNPVKQKISAALKTVEEKWAEILAGVKPLNHSVEALLKAARPAKIEGEVLTLEVFYKFHKDRLDSEKCRVIVEEVVSQKLGCPVKLKCVLGQKPSTGISTVPASGQTDSAVPGNEGDILEVANNIFNGSIN
jgi:DNA polymerase-3 subunit gamma/tau